MMTSIDTAVPLFEKKDLEQPLLIETTTTTTTEEEYLSWYNIHLGGDGDEEDKQKKRTSSTDASCWWQCLNEFLLVFIIGSCLLTIFSCHPFCHLAGR